MKRPNFFQFTNGLKAPLPFSNREYENRLKGLRKIMAEKNLEAWLMVFHAGVLCSLMGHMSMFYLYKFYSVGQVLPFYALFPIFGMLLSFFIFGEIPTLIMVIGGIIVITSVFLLQKTS